jgi:hypothetical protein
VLTDPTPPPFIGIHDVVYQRGDRVQGQKAAAPFIEIRDVVAVEASVRAIL